METPFLRFTLWPETGFCELLDKRAHLARTNDPLHPRLGRLLLYVHGSPRHLELSRCQVQNTGDALMLLFRPIPDQPLNILRVWVRPLADQKTLQVSYQQDDELDVENLSLFGDLLRTAAAGKGYLAVPCREGLLIPADSPQRFTHRFDTYGYEGCHMAMFGVVQAGAAALVTWTDPYAALQLSKTAEHLTPALVLTKSARAFRIHLLGKGDYVTIAQAYRQVAQEEGWLVTWKEKLRSNPERAKLFGAGNFKLWSALSRRMDPQSTRTLSLRTNWTFAEAAQVAEHLKHDLKLDRMLFTVGGWLHRGYDNQHPDILPAAPECGGNDALADCARRVRQLGYLFCLHDNYQDLYRDSPSWNEDLIMEDSDGHLIRGGRWDGGRAYLICPQQAVTLAQRPQNLPSVKRLFSPNAYFIDTTYAAPLRECYDPHHPLTFRDDLRWRQALSDYARGLFGVFGSEDGREWAIPHSDFFEGLTGVSGHDYHDAGLPERLGATVIPLFDLVYHDCIALYGKYGYDPRQAAGYVLRHISLARPLNYHGIPPHLYWQRPAQANPPQPPRPAAGPDPALFARADNGWAAGLDPLDRFVKNTYEILSPLNELSAQLPMTRHEFLTPDREVQRTTFGQGKDAIVIIINTGPTNFVCSSTLGGKTVLPPYGFLAESPRFLAFTALTWNKLTYTTPTLFTLRSLDGKPLAHSHQIRVYHGFGDKRLRLAKAIHTIPREALLQPGPKQGTSGNE